MATNNVILEPGEKCNVCGQRWMQGPGERLPKCARCGRSCCGDAVEGVIKRGPNGEMQKFVEHIGCVINDKHCRVCLGLPIGRPILLNN